LVKAVALSCQFYVSFIELNLLVLSHPCLYTSKLCEHVIKWCLLVLSEEHTGTGTSAESEETVAIKVM